MDIDSDSYKVARQYMVRLEDSDFSEVKTTARLALIGKLSKDEFERRFKYLINDPPVRPEGEETAREMSPAPAARDQESGS